MRCGDARESASVSLIILSLEVRRWTDNEPQTYKLSRAGEIVTPGTSSVPNTLSRDHAHRVCTGSANPLSTWIRDVAVDMVCVTRCRT